MKTLLTDRFMLSCGLTLFAFAGALLSRALHRWVAELEAQRALRELGASTTDFLARARSPGDRHRCER